MRLQDRAALDFVLTLRRRWADTVYPKLHEEFEAEFAGRRPNGPDALAALVQDLPTYGSFAWLERGSQKMLWRAVIDALDGQPGEKSEAAEGPARLEIDPSLALPDWYTGWDIHLQPGGVWSGASAARVYELGAKLVMLGDNDDYKFHTLFVVTAIPDRPYRRIVDLGCGFGKSTWPLRKTFPDAEVIGIDLAAPCLELALEKANERGLAIRFRQADAEATGIESASVDLVTSTMFIHELPLDVLARVFAETARILAPGGIIRFLDFQRTGDPLRDLAMTEHGARNNEPFLPPMMDADLQAMAAAAGLTNWRVTAFDERDQGRLETRSWPSRREWHFPWAVVEAEKPA